MFTPGRGQQVSISDMEILEITQSAYNWGLTLSFYNAMLILYRMRSLSAAILLASLGALALVHAADQSAMVSLHVSCCLKCFMITTILLSTLGVYACCVLLPEGGASTGRHSHIHVPPLSNGKSIILKYIFMHVYSLEGRFPGN